MIEYSFGRIKSKPDFNDYKLGAFIPKNAMVLGTFGSKKWDFPSPPLNQNLTNHCVGFSMADWGICLPTNTAYTDQDGHDFYYKCKIIEGEAKQENGACIRSAAKVLKSTGKISSYAFASSVDEIKWWIINKGPVIVGSSWTEGMCLADIDNYVRPTGEILGGHAYLLTEIREDNYFGIQNSWGSFWGSDLTKPGKAYISESDFTSLFVYDGEALATIELETPIVKTNPWIDFILKLIKMISER